MTHVSVIRNTLVAGLALASLQTFGGKKYIAFGWEFDKIGPEDLLRKIAEYDASPLDGVGVFYTMTDESGRPCGARTIMETGPWTQASAEANVPVLRELARHRSMRASMLTSFRHPVKRIPWTDEAAWARVATNLERVAYMASASGLNGLYADQEDYEKQGQFVLRDEDGDDFEALSALARRRGAQLFGPVFAHCPRARLFVMRFFCADPGFWNGYYGSHDPVATMRMKGDLWPSFANGILDVLPSGATIVEGDEHGYRYDAGRRDYLLAYNQIHARLLPLVAPENRTKYRAQVRASSAIYLDGLADGKSGGSYYQGAADEPRMHYVEKTLHQAAWTTDEFVWFWGEKHPWIDWGKTKINPSVRKEELWETVLPGLDGMLRANRDPLGYMRGRLAEMRADGTYTNLLAGVRLEDYPTWQAGPPRKKHIRATRLGTFGVTDGMLWSEGCENGCYTVPVENLEPGTWYAVRLEARGRRTYADVRFKKDGRWRNLLPGVSLLPSGPVRDGWQLFETLVRIPEGSNELNLVFSSREGVGERSWYRDVEVVPVPFVAKVKSTVKQGTSK